MAFPKTLQSNRYPDFIRSHSSIKKYSSVEKNFSKIGLKRFSQKYTHKSKTTIEEYVIMLKKTLSIYVERMVGWDDYCDYCSKAGYEKIKIEIIRLCSHIAASSIKKNNQLVIPCEIEITSLYNGKLTTYKKNSSLLGFLNSICRDIFAVIGKEDPQFSDLLKYGVDLELSFNKSLKIVFSDHPWDITTMSMRGVSSCQTWDKKQATHLVGSVLDPNMAIVYMTDGKAHGKYGERMLGRMVVRLVMPLIKVDNGMYINTSSSERRKRFLFCEGAYGYFSTSPLYCNILNDIFGSVLSGKVQKSKYLPRGKYLFQNIDHSKTQNRFVSYCIPSSPQIRGLKEKYLSYRDSGLEYLY